MLEQLKKLLIKPKFQPSNRLPRFEAYLSFLNRLEFPTQFIAVLEAEPHRSEDMAGWQGLESLTCLGENGKLYDIDIRHAWGAEIFKQHLFDYGCSETTLLHKRLKNEPSRNKLIVYLCESSVGFKEKQRLDKIPNHLLVGCYWQSIHHLYLTLPADTPFALPQISSRKFSDRHDYATTRCLSPEEPVISNLPHSRIKTVLRFPPDPERKGEGGLRTKGIFKHHSLDKPLISVITVVFNGERYIEQTIQSAINQSYSNIELIVIDGGSTDGTLDILCKYEDQIDYWISEPDSGIYDAMNKGFMLAAGNFVNFLNVGDLFCSSRAIESLKFTNCVDSVCGTSIFFSNLVSNTFCFTMSNVSFPHQALFMARKDFEYNIFNTQFKYSGDAELWTRFNSINNTIYFQNVPVSANRFGGISTSSNYLVKRMKEHLKFNPNKFQVLLRFIPKIIVSRILSESLIEIVYFKLRNQNLKI